MKKFYVLMFFLLAVPIAMFAQTEIPVPTLQDVFGNPLFWVSAFLPLCGLTIFITASLIKLFKVTGSGIKQIISWGVGPVLVVILNLLHLGVAGTLIWYGIIAYAIAVTLASNKMFDAKLLESILAMLNLVKPKKPTAK
jgi:hypothetical protein